VCAESRGRSFAGLRIRVRLSIDPVLLAARVAPVATFVNLDPKQVLVGLFISFEAA
jgi:hypothetical protein